jgi:hypothetical protein
MHSQKIALRLSDPARNYGDVSGGLRYQHDEREKSSMQQKGHTFTASR